MSAVEWKKLGDLGSFENIGVDKKIIEGEPEVILLNYVDVYKNKHINKDIPAMKVTAPIKKVQACNVLEGDIFVTPTSETKDDIGHSSVVVETLDNTVYSYHIMRYRLHKKNMITSHYINYIFDTISVKDQIYKYASGLTRFGLSKDKFASIQIPIPSLSKQQEIVSHLDSFTTLISSLESELEMRRKQYEHYRDELLDLEEKEGVEIKSLGTLCEVTDYVANGSFASLRENVKYKQEPDYALLVRTVDLSQNFEGEKIYINERAYKFLSKSVLYGGEIIINNIGAGVGKTFRCPHLGVKMSLAPNSIMVKTSNNDFFYHWFNSLHGQSAIAKIITPGAMPKFNKTSFKTIEIPLPSLSTQQEIVEKLDAFEQLIQSLETEIKLRKQQYEYYREKLLTFE